MTRVLFALLCFLAVFQTIGSENATVSTSVEDSPTKVGGPTKKATAPVIPQISKKTSKKGPTTVGVPMTTKTAPVSKKPSKSTTVQPSLKVTPTNVSHAEEAVPQNETSSSANSSVPQCNCSPECEPLVENLCARNKTINRPDCPCCTVCMGMEDDDCDAVSRPCYEEFGLKCISEKCQYELKVDVARVSSSKIVLTWNIDEKTKVSYSDKYLGLKTAWLSSDAKFDDVSREFVISNLRSNTGYHIKIQTLRTFRILQATTTDADCKDGDVGMHVGDVLHHECIDTCTCMEDGKIECLPRCEFRAGDKSDPKCKEEPDPNDKCCVQYKCQVETTDESPKQSTMIDSSDVAGRKLSVPQILVTKRTPSSISIGWDDFKLPSDTHGYVVEYRMEKSIKGKKNDDKMWKRLDISDIALATVSNLQPKTKYQIRVSVYENYDAKKLKSNSQVLSVLTEDGCIKNNRTYEIKEKFDDGCQARCTCLGGNQLDCYDICKSPYFRAGTVDHDPYCFERPSKDEPCCVTVICTSGGVSTPAKEVQSKQAAESNKNSSACPDPPLDVILDDGESCPDDCTSDKDCPIGNCCKNSCGGTSCSDDQSVSTDDLCQWTFCGPNSKCVYDGIPECICLPGFNGDANDPTVGCTKDQLSDKSVKLDLCPDTFASVGEECDSSCSSDDDCVKEMKCCKTRCGGAACVPVSPVNATKLNVKRCVFKDKFYDIGQDFYDGCEYKCSCSKLAEIVCEPRCGSKIDDSVRDNPNCRVDKDKKDSCCEVAVCSGDEATEKLNVTTAKKITTPTNPTKKPSKTNKVIPVFDGCVYKNQTYRMGEKFNYKCESSCECGGFGIISCVPRCPSVNSPGPHCSLQVDPKDSCCKITVCNFPGGKVKSHKIKDLKVILESVTPRNSSVVRVTFTTSNTSSVSNKSVEIWYVSEANLASEQWEKDESIIYAVTNAKSEAFYTDIEGLKPKTTYYFKVGIFSKDRNSPLFSNTADIKTYPKYIGSVFDGCFRGNSTYEANEEFYDGCDFKCLCHVGGRIQCKDRCTQYKDTSGYEHCTWRPSPDDNCCIVPFCDALEDLSLSPTLPKLVSPNDNKQHETKIEKPTKEAFCMHDNKKYPVKATWEIGSGCLRGVCICVQNIDGSTKVDCVGGCPHIPRVLTPSSECPYPKVVPSDDPCTCPRVTCNDFTQGIVETKPMCSFKNKRYNVGEEFYDGCDGVCMCTTSLKVHCQTVRCPSPPAAFSSCIEWEVPKSFIPRPPNCCPPPPVCKNDGSCLHRNKRFRNFQKIPSSLVDCGMECNCINGKVTCNRNCALPPRVPPSSLGCPAHTAVVKPTRVDRNTCCLMWTCKRKPVIKSGFQDVKVSPLNATSIRVRFVIPQSLLGHRGHAEIHYTNNPRLNINRWQKKRFARPQNIFDTTHIEYHLAKLHPNTNYLVQLKAISHETKEVIQSKIISVRTAPDKINDNLSRTALPPPVLPSDRLPPPRQYPPQEVKLNMNIKTVVTSSSSVKVMWRQFDRNEREVISGVRIVASAKDDGHEEISPLIHQDVQTYEVKSLKPEATYILNLEIVAYKNEPMSFTSANPVTVVLPKDEFDMSVKLKAAEASPYGVELKWDGLSKSADKYINVAQIMYQSDDDTEVKSQFQKVESTDNGIMLKELEPGRRYKMWAVLYLKNGKSLKLDPLEINTPSGPPRSRQIDKEKLLGSSKNDSSSEGKSYYTALVVVAVIAALVALAFLIVLFVLLRRRRHSSAKVPINHSQTAYNNPAFKNGSDTGNNYVEQNGGENKVTA